MALSKKNNEQISFDELEFEAEYSEQTETKYLTISGKEQEYEPTWEKYTLRDLDVGETMEGRVEIVHYPNDDKKYDDAVKAAKEREEAEKEENVVRLSESELKVLIKEAVREILFTL